MEPGAEALLTAQEEESPDKNEEEDDINSFPDRVRELFLSGDRKSASAVLQALCQKYKTRNETDSTIKVV